MILVLLGTQDKPFTRLLEAVDKLNTKEKIVVQAGTTKYQSENMKIFDLIPTDDLNQMMKEAKLIITHGGVGSIIEGLKLKKIVIAAPRLKEHGEHVNNHQLEIIEKFEKEGYILALKDFNKLSELIKKAKTFKPTQYVSNTENFVKFLEEFIDNN